MNFIFETYINFIAILTVPWKK